MEFVMEEKSLNHIWEQNQSDIFLPHHTKTGLIFAQLLLILSEHIEMKPLQ